MLQRMGLSILLAIVTHTVNASQYSHLCRNEMSSDKSKKPGVVISKRDLSFVNIYHERFGIWRDSVTTTVQRKLWSHVSPSTAAQSNCRLQNHCKCNNSSMVYVFRNAKIVLETDPIGPSSITIFAWRQG